MCCLILFFFSLSLKRTNQSMSAGDYPYYNLALPLPQDQFSQQKVGYIEIDALGGTAVSSFGNIILHSDSALQGDGEGTVTSNDNVPSLFFNGSCVNVSATTTNCMSGLQFTNVSYSPTLGIKNGLNYSANVPTKLTTPWYKEGGVYLTSCENINGNNVYCLGFMP